MGLEGKIVLLTRPRRQNSSLRSGLERFGAEVVEIPTIEIAGPETWEPVDRAIDLRSQYDWVIFTSANAVDAFFDRAGKLVLTKVAAVGPQTASRLEERGQTVHIVPKGYRSEGLLESLPSNLNGARILLPRAAVAGQELPREMRNRGAVVDEIVVYRTTRPLEGHEELRQLLEERRVDCIAFTSGSTVRNLIDMLDGSDYRSLLSRVAVAVIGPATRQVATQAGLRVDIEAKNATAAELAMAIRVYFERQD